MKPKLTGRILRHILELNKISRPNVALFVYSHVLWSFWDKILSQIKFILPNNLSFSFPICLLLKMSWRFSETFPSWDLILWVTPSPFIICTCLLNHEVMWNIVTDRTWHALSWSQMHQLGSLWSNKLHLWATWKLKTGLFCCFFEDQFTWITENFFQI